MKEIYVRQQDVTDLLGQLYDAASDGGSWSLVLEQLAKFTNSTAVNLHTFDTASGQSCVRESFGADPAFVRQYNEHYQGINPLSKLARARLHTGSILTSHALIADKDLVRTQFYEDFLHPQNHFYMLNVTLCEDVSVFGGITMARPRAAGSYSEAELNYFQLLMPHLQRAAQLQRRLSGVVQERAALTDALELLPQGIIIVNQKRQVRFANRSARMIVAGHDGLTVNKQGELCASSSTETVEVRRLLLDAIGTTANRETGAGGAMRVMRPSGKRSLCVLVAPLGTAHRESCHDLLEHDSPAAIIFISDPECEVEIPAQVLRRLYGLTPAEAKLTTVLVQGRCIEEAAAELCVSLNTARTHLKRIFEKTETHRQSELIKLLLASYAFSIVDN